MDNQYSTFDQHVNILGSACDGFIICTIPCLASYYLYQKLLARGYGASRFCAPVVPIMYFWTLYLWTLTPQIGAFEIVKLMAIVIAWLPFCHILMRLLEFEAFKDCAPAIVTAWLASYPNQENYVGVFIGNRIGISTCWLMSAFLAPVVFVWLVLFRPKRGPVRLALYMLGLVLSCNPSYRVIEQQLPNWLVNR